MELPRKSFEDRIYLGLLSIIHVHGQDLLRMIYTSITNRPPDMPLMEYLNKAKGLGMTYIRKCFSRQDRAAISANSSCSTFSISLLYRLIQLEGTLAHTHDSAWSTSGTLENSIKRIKDFRNMLMHSMQEVTADHHLLEELHYILREASRLAVSGNVINEEDADMFIINLSSEMDSLRAGPHDLQNPEASPDASIRDFNIFKDLFEVRGRAGLLQTFQMLSHMKTPCFIAGQRAEFKVEQIFTHLQIVKEGSQKKTDNVDFYNILKLAHSPRKRRESLGFIIIKGPSGVGKKTLIKRIWSDWVLLASDPSKFCEIKELDEYDFVIPVDCRSFTYDSVSNFFCSLMPDNLRKYFKEDQHMMEYLYAFRVLFIMYGINEMNVELRKTFLESLSQKRKKGFYTVMCITEPGNTDEILSSITENSHILSLNILGFAKGHKETFVENYHKMLTDSGISKQGTNGLLTYLETTGSRLQEAWCLPLNLSILTFLWAFQGNRVHDVTTYLELMLQVHQLTMTKIRQQLISESDISLSELENIISNLLFFLSEAALLGVRDSSLLIPKDTIQKLSDIHPPLQVPPKELIGAFPIQNSWFHSDSGFPVAFTQKNNQELYAAIYLYNEIFGAENKIDWVYRTSTEDIAIITPRPSVPQSLVNGKTTTKLRSIIQGPTSNEMHSHSLERYRNTLVFLLGLISHIEPVVYFQPYVNELIELMSEAGITLQEDWMKVLNSFRCHDAITALICQKYSLAKEIVNVMDEDVFAFASIFKVKLPEIVKVNIAKRISSVARLDDLLATIAEGRVLVEELYLQYPFCHPEAEHHRMDHVGKAIENIDSLIERCHVKEYRGLLPSVFPVKEELKILSVSLDDDRDVSILWNYLQLRKQPLPALEINVGKISKDKLLPISGDVVGGLNLFIPLVGEGDEGCDRAIDIIHSLKPVTGKNRCFDWIYFPQCCFYASKEIKNLLLGLKDVRVIFGVVFPSHCRPSNREAENELQKQARKNLLCRYGIFWGGGPEDTIYDLDSWDESRNKENASVTLTEDKSPLISMIRALETERGSLRTDKSALLSKIDHLKYDLEEERSRNQTTINDLNEKIAHLSIDKEKILSEGDKGTPS